MRNEAGEREGQRALPRSGRADDEEQLPRLELERQIPNCVRACPVVAETEPLGADRDGA
jgi:hypothetical protein